VSLHSLPIFVRLAGRRVILVGSGEAAEAKRRLLERAGATIVGEDAEASLAIVVDDEDAVHRLKARGVLVNAVDRPELCDFTLPAIVDRAPVIVAVGTGGVSAGLAAALRQRLELLLPSTLGDLAVRLNAARVALRRRYPLADERRRAIARALEPGGVIDPLGHDPDFDAWLGPEDTDGGGTAMPPEIVFIRLTSGRADDLTLGQARALAQADRVYHAADVPAAILDRARADADRCAEPPPAALLPGLSVWLEFRA
jgi:uroporphyrin-III C-methyltransferase / precorrin-2 dehydrogenase / sirohydrochlorin ferrochelatase